MSLTSLANALGNDTDEAMALMERCVVIGDQWLKESSDSVQLDVKGQVYVWWMNLGIGLFERERRTFKGTVPKKALVKHTKRLERSIELLTRAFVFCSKTFGKKNRETIHLKDCLKIAEAKLAAAKE